MDFFKFTQQNECMNQKKLYDEDCERHEKKNAQGNDFEECESKQSSIDLYIHM